MLTEKEKRAAKIIAKQPYEHREAVHCSFEQFFSQEKIPPKHSNEIYSGEWVKEVETFIEEFHKEVEKNIIA